MIDDVRIGPADVGWWLDGCHVDVGQHVDFGDPLLQITSNPVGEGDDVTFTLLSPVEGTVTVIPLWSGPLSVAGGASGVIGLKGTLVDSNVPIGGYTGLHPALLTNLSVEDCFCGSRFWRGDLNRRVEPLLNPTLCSNCHVNKGGRELVIHWFDPDAILHHLESLQGQSESERVSSHTSPFVLFHHGRWSERENAQQEGQGGDERRFDRSNDRRGGDRDQRGGGDWTCPQCSNSNFSFRMECNRCSAPRGDKWSCEKCGKLHSLTVMWCDGCRTEGPDWVCPGCSRLVSRWHNECVWCKSQSREGVTDSGDSSLGTTTPRHYRNQRRSPIYVEWGDANQIERILDAAFWKPGLEEVEQLHRTIAPSFLAHVLQQPCVGGKAAALQLWQVAGCPKPEDDQPEVWGYVLATSHARLGDAEQDIRKRLEEVERLKEFSQGRLYEGALQVEPRLLQRSEGLHAAGGSSLAFAMNILDVLGPLGIEAHPVLIEHLLMGVRTVRETARLLDAYGGNKELIRRVTEEGEDEMAVAVELGLYQF